MVRATARLILALIVVIVLGLLVHQHGVRGAITKAAVALTSLDGNAGIH